MCGPPTVIWAGLFFLSGIAKTIPSQESVQRPGWDGFSYVIIFPVMYFDVFITCVRVPACLSSNQNCFAALFSLLTFLARSPPYLFFNRLQPSAVPLLFSLGCTRCDPPLLIQPFSTRSHLVALLPSPDFRQFSPPPFISCSLTKRRCSSV